jgi:hypothetical protein
LTQDELYYTIHELSTFFHPSFLLFFLLFLPFCTIQRRLPVFLSERSPADHEVLKQILKGLPQISELLLCISCLTAIPSSFPSLLLISQRPYPG